MRLCPSQVQLSLNPLDVRSVVAAMRQWVIALRGDGSGGLFAVDSEENEWSSGVRSVFAFGMQRDWR